MEFLPVKLTISHPTIGLQSASMQCAVNIAGASQPWSWNIIWKAQGKVNKFLNPGPLNMHLARNNKILVGSGSAN